jgi:hypothetical protein
LRDLGGRHGVVAIVDLDQRKLRGVKAEPLFRCVALRWVEAARCDQALVSSRGSANKNLRHSATELRAMPSD